MAITKVPKPDAPTSKVTFAGIPIKKRDTQATVVDNLMYEDQFAGLYWSDVNATNLLIEPPYNPKVLFGLVTKNNILSQCISAMEVNVDGTGYTIEPVDETSNADPDDEYKTLDAFLKEPFPEVGLISIRRRLRIDLESTGNAYLEVLRSLAGDVTFLRWVDSTDMRLVKLDEAVEVEKQITRNGKKVTAKMLTRERRYAQKVGEQTIFFKEFGASREIDRNTGEWVDGKNQGAKVTKADKEQTLGTEIIHLKVNPDANSAYGLPRWINQVPSVLGSRKAEEFNLEFFDSGGVPPAAIFIQGGAVADDVTQQLKAYFNGDASSKHRVAIVEVQSASGSLANPGSVKVTTERFGESKNDAMFQDYDKNCEEHIRVGFRLHPLFLGRAQDYNFATAMTGYMVTEAQVFAPERVEFDEIINNKIVRAMGITKWTMKSKPLTIKNVEVQLSAMELVKTMIDPEDLIGSVNDMVSLDLKYSKEAHDKHLESLNPIPPAMPGQPAAGGKVTPAAVGKPKTTQPSNVTPIKDAKDTRRGKLVKKAEEMDAEDVVTLVTDWSIAMGLEVGEIDDEAVTHVLKAARDLNDSQRRIFNNVLATKAFVGVGIDAEGLAAIAGCCAHAME